MRIFVLTALLATPSHAWEFIPDLPCKLLHKSSQGEILLTYDPTQPLYSITVTRQTPWPEAPSFSMRFDGPQGRVIGTDRHQLSDDRLSLTVTDKGFGNVLDGLQFNMSTTAIAGDVEATFALDGASDAVAAFRACEGAVLSWNVVQRQARL